MRDTRLLICERRDGEAVSCPIELYKMLRQVFAVQRVISQQKSRQRVRFAQLLPHPRSHTEDDVKLLLVAHERLARKSGSRARRASSAEGRSLSAAAK